MKNILLIANNTVGSGMSGGDRIWINFIRYWGERSGIRFMGSKEAVDMLKREQIDEIPVNIIISDENNIPYNLNSLLSLLRFQIKRIFKGIKSAYNNLELINNSEFVYSVAYFYPDFLTALFIKIMNKKIKWIVGYYLIAPFPMNNRTPYRGKHRLKGFIYWLMQRPSLYITRHFADYVFVTSEPDINNFISRKITPSKVVVVKGGIDLKSSEDYIKKIGIIPLEERKYDACFVGRLHVQKGIFELIDIWNIVNKKIGGIKLAIIGDGELKKEMEDGINRYHLNNYVDILGFLDGEDKYDVFRNSKIILHPAIYDSGGMAMAEGMVFGLPGISFNLEALDTYYPKGVLKIPCFELEMYADGIIKLLKDREYYEKFSKEAYEYAKTWDWEKRTYDIFRHISDINSNRN